MRHWRIHTHAHTLDVTDTAGSPPIADQGLWWIIKIFGVWGWVLGQQHSLPGQTPMLRSTSGADNAFRTNCCNYLRAQHVPKNVIVRLEKDFWPFFPHARLHLPTCLVLRCPTLPSPPLQTSLGTELHPFPSKNTPPASHQ